MSAGYLINGRQTYRIASIPADGIGPEVISAGITVLKKLASTLDSFNLEFENFDWSSEYYKKHGKYLPDNALDTLRKYDAILFGAVGAPDVPDHISLWGLRLAICQPLQQYANVRPTKVFRGTQSPLRNCATGDLDWVIIRENSEGEYAGHGGRSHIGTPWEVATEVSIFTAQGVRRLMEFAFKAAQSRPKKHITVVTKSNAQRNGMVMWDEIAAETAKQYPDVECDKMLVDAMTTRMVLKPESLDTIVATNLHADILSDLAAALAGSIGIAPTSNLDPTRQNPSMFEPIHGSAFDITGKGIANPVATFWTASEMLAWLGEKMAASVLLECVESVCDKGIVTQDLGGKSSTVEVTDAMVCVVVSRTEAESMHCVSLKKFSKARAVGLIPYKSWRQSVPNEALSHLGESSIKLNFYYGSLKPKVAVIESPWSTPRRGVIQMSNASYQNFTGDNVTDAMLNEAAKLFNQNYGVWGEGSHSPGKPVRLSGGRLREQYLPDPSACSYARVTVDGTLAGNAFTCRWKLDGRNICWVTQLVVDRDYREHGLATTLLSWLQNGMDDIYGIMSSHPAACLASATSFGAYIERMPFEFARENAEAATRASPIPYIREAKLRGSLFDPSDSTGLVCGVDTGFFVDHGEPLEALERVRRVREWSFGELPEGHEYLIVVPARKHRSKLRSSSASA
ncbi:tartrate dehydrogenase [Polytolypa hystricis UAMH7299]|uniref:D-malate dehydrogenase (decarboxylating) n=1 Tax=Polytolypa hystricis (strain UAMH7299) TaxID=1447883 RepID=A0A2B7YDG3_POLH7|nr:tartrate dehydrogenase [Polytolypa hystricis UAMH7299]